MEEHDESSVDDVSNALQSGNLTSLAAILQVCRDGGLHKNNEEEPFKGANNKTTNQKQVDAHQRAHKSDQYPENHPLARIRRKRRRTYDRKSLADVISTCRSEGKQAFYDVANVPESDLVRIEELQREMGVDIANTKIHVSDAKLRRRQSKLSMSSSVTILTGTGSGSVVVVSATTSRDSSLPSTNKSSSQRTPIIPPQGDISSEDWLQIRMRKRSKRYRQSEPELLKGNGNLDHDTRCAGNYTTTDTMERNLVTHVEDFDTPNEDTSGDGMSLADPQFAAEKKVDVTEVTKMTDENMRSNEQNLINSDNNSEKENVIEEVKIKDGNVTLVLYKVKEKSFLKMNHEHQTSESRGKMDDSISISYYNQHDRTDIYTSEEAYNSTRTNDNASPLKDTYIEKEKDDTDSDTRRGSHSSSMTSEAYNLTRTYDNSSPLRDTYIEKDDTDSDTRRRSHSFSLTSDVCIGSQMKTNNEGMNNERGVTEHINECIPHTFNYSHASTAPVTFELNTTELSGSNTDINTLDTVLFTENIQSENDVVNGNTSYAAVSSECTKDSYFQDSNMLNTSTNKTEMKDDRITSGTAVTNDSSIQRSTGLLVSSNMDLRNINEDRGTKDKHITPGTKTKPNDDANDKPISNNVSLNIQKRNGSKETESMEVMSTKSFPMSVSNTTKQKNKRNSTSTSRMSEMSPAAREILLMQSLKQMNDNAIKRQGSFLNVLSSFRADMQMIVSDLKSDIHIENTLAVKEDVEKKTPKDTLDKEPAVKDEESDTESEADDKEEKQIVAEESERESEADYKEEKHIVAEESDTESEADDKEEKNTVADESDTKFEADDKEEKHIVAEESDTESKADDKEEENIVARLGYKIDTDPNKEIIARIKRTAKSYITSKWSPGHKRRKRPANENSSSVSSGDDNSQVEQELRLLRQKEHLIKTSPASRVYEDEAIRLNPTDNVLVGNEYDLSTKYYAVEKQFASKSSQNNVKHKNERQSKVEFDTSEKKTVEQNTYTIRANITKSKNSLSRREQYNSDNNDTANSIETARQSVDSGIVLANILEDQRSTAKHETNRGRALKNRHLSGDHAERRQPSIVSTNSSLSELKRKPRKVYPGIDVASRIVDSRKQFYQSGTVHSTEIREHRIMKLFREIQRVRKVSVFPSSYDVIEDETSGFLMIDYEKQRRIDTFSDREAIDRFLYKPVQYELCCKVNGVSVNFRRKEKACKALKQKQVHSKVS